MHGFMNFNVLKFKNSSKIIKKDPGLIHKGIYLWLSMYMQDKSSRWENCNKVLKFSQFGWRYLTCNGSGEQTNEQICMHWTNLILNRSLLKETVCLWALVLWFQWLSSDITGQIKHCQKIHSPWFSFKLITFQMLWINNNILLDRSQLNLTLRQGSNVASDLVKRFTTWDFLYNIRHCIGSHICL